MVDENSSHQLKYPYFPSCVYMVYSLESKLSLLDTLSIIKGGKPMKELYSVPIYEEDLTKELKVDPRSDNRVTPTES